MEDVDYRQSILAKLWIRGKIGQDYQPVEKAMSDIPTDQHDHAKEAVESLTKQGLVIRKKGGDVISLNPKRMGDIRDIIEEVVPDYVLNLR